MPAEDSYETPIQNGKICQEHKLQLWNAYMGHACMPQVVVN